MHRERRSLTQRVPRGKRYVDVLERSGIVATYELHDRLLGNRRSRRLHRTAPPALDDVQQEIVSSLRANGFAEVPFHDLVVDPELEHAVLAQGAAFVAETEAALRAEAAGEQAALRRRAGKEFVVRAYSFDGVVLGAESPWFRACVSDRMLAIANAYLGMWSKLSYVDLWYTAPQPAGADRVASQLWHVDFDDRHLLKAFLYLVDVDADAGPFEYVPGSQPGGRYEHIRPWRPMGNARVSDDELAAHVAPGGVHTFTAPRGTLIFCNTSGLHRGGFATAKPRALATATFCSPASLAALSLRNYTVADTRELGPAARFAVD
jgi:hypothetical protein